MIKSGKIELVKNNKHDYKNSPFEVSLNSNQQWLGLKVVIIDKVVDP